VVKLVLTADGTTQFFPMAYFTPVDQTFLKQLPLNLTLQYPMEYSLTDQAGKSIPVRLEAGNAQVVKTTYLSDGSTHYYPIALLSEMDQKLLFQMPASSVNLSFPLLCTLTDLSGRQQAVRLEGRTNEAVKFTLLSDGSSHVYPLAKLGLPDQTFLRMIPINLGTSEATVASTKSTAVEAAYVQSLLDRLASLKSETAQLQAQITDPNTMANDRQFAKEKVDRDKQEIRSLTQQLQTAQSNGSP
jgi:hypothetical protein